VVASADRRAAEQATGNRELPSKLRHPRRAGRAHAARAARGSGAI